MVPGPFTDFVDDAATESLALQSLLPSHVPDPRMRDVELAARFFAFRNFVTDYGGRMKSFLDDACGRLHAADSMSAGQIERRKFGAKQTSSGRRQKC
jgi:hypothetical protein